MKHKYKFSTKKHSVGGTISSIMAVSAVALFVRAVYLSFKAAGEGGTLIGALALSALAVAFFGLVIGLLSYKESDRYYTFSFIGSLSNGIMLVLMVMLLIVGI
ncbi:MAG: DUF6142 family protein [Butyrivibrio sp.]